MIVYSPRFRLALLSILLVTGCVGTADRGALYAEAARDDPRGRPYVIGVADVVRVAVWKDPNLSSDVVVRPDGTVTLPLVGEVVASGRTVRALQAEVEKRLSTFAKDTVVTVSVTEVNSYHFTVTGNVEHPGLFTPRYFMTVSEGIALAGGPNRYADASSMVIVRTVRGRALRIPVDYERILSGKAPEQDLVLLAGDAVRVP
jgi:polysaccharide biosynthesis/export protein